MLILVLKLLLFAVVYLIIGAVVAGLLARWTNWKIRSYGQVLLAWPFAVAGVIVIGAVSQSLTLLSKLTDFVFQFKLSDVSKWLKRDKNAKQ